MCGHHLIGTEKYTFWHENSPDADFDGEEQTTLRVSTFFLLPFFPSFNYPTPEKASSFGATRGSQKRSRLLFSDFSRGSIVTYPTYLRHTFKRQQKAGQSLDSHLVAFSFVLFFSFLSKFFSDLVIEGGRVNTGSENPLFFISSFLVCSITYLGEHIFYLLCVCITCCRIGRRLEFGRELH